MGRYDHSLDPKNRLILPRSFRGALEDGVVLTAGLEEFVYVFPVAAFAALAEKVGRLPLLDAGGRDFTRVFISNAREEQADAQGRVPIAASLRQYAGLEREVVVVGQINHVELWNPAYWEESFRKARASFEDGGGAQRLASMGI